MKRMYPVVAMLLLASPALAETRWAKGLERGLETYSLEQGDSGVKLICDPERVFGNDVSNAGLRVTFPSDSSASVMIVLGENGEQAAFTIVDGGANEALSTPEDWTRMISILGAGGAFAFVTGQDALQFEDIAALPDLQC